MLNYLQRFQYGLMWSAGSINRKLTLALTKENIGVKSNECLAAVAGKICRNIKVSK